MKTLLLLLAIALAGCGKSGPTDPLHAAARQTCTKTIESRAINPKSIAYLSDDPAVVKNAKGQLEASIKFSAKNEIGGASTMIATCTVSADGQNLVDIAVKTIR